MAYFGKRVKVIPKPAVRRPARKQEEIIIEPSEFECCALGVCPQHQSQGESDVLTQRWNRLPRTNGKTYSGPWLDPD